MRNRLPRVSHRADSGQGPLRTALLVVAALCSNQVAWAQGPVIDQGVLRIRLGRTEVAREEFTLTRGSIEGGAGLRITATAFYPPRRTRVTIRPTLELDADSQPRLVRFDAQNGGGVTVQAQIGPRRLAIQRLSSAGESWREYPVTTRVWVVDDSTFSLYAVPPGMAPGTVRLVSPRQDTQVEYELANRGLEETVVDGRRRRLLHLALTAGTDARHVWYDDEGRLMKVEVAALGLTAERISRR